MIMFIHVSTVCRALFNYKLGNIISNFGVIKAISVKRRFVPNATLLKMLKELSCDQGLGVSQSPVKSEI